jgi:sulfite exporter TauE/SafE
MSSTLTLIAAFIAGLTGSMHCLVMCGGIAGALGMRARSISRTAPLTFLHSLAYQVGRLSSYAMAGALVGAFGAVVQALLYWLPIALMLRIIAGLVLMLLGLQLMLNWKLLQPLEKLGATFWRCLAPVTRHASGHGLGHALLLGALWGWLPCGLIYSMLLLGALQGTALHGAMIMLAFGAGTLPAMLGSSLISAQLSRITSLREMRIFTGLLLLLLGWWTMWVATQHHS